MKRGQPSATASLILKATWFLSKDPRHGALVPPGARALASRSLRTVIPLHPIFRVLCVFPLRPLLSTLEWVLLPGFTLHVACRKAQLEALAREAHAEGFRQMVILGGGYDSLGLRLAQENDGFTVIEIDHPATQSMKKRSLEGEPLPEHFILAPVDLGLVPLGEALASVQGFDPGAKTLIVAEGVLMYLQPTAVENLFRTLPSIFPEGVRFLFTAMDTPHGQSPRFRNVHPWVSGWLARKNEKFSWGFPMDGMAGYLEGLGYSRTAVFGHEALARLCVQGPEDPPLLAEGEFICRCDARGPRKR